MNATLRVLTKAVIGIAALAATAAAPADPRAVGSAFLEAADRMVSACFADAAARRLPPLSVVVVDGSGALIAFRRQDGAMPVSAEAALLKARTAVRTQAPTAALAPVVAADANTRDMFQILSLTGMPGGVPFASTKAGIAGAVGVSGAAPPDDAACAQAAVGAL